MKKIFITTLILVTTLVMVGCASAESKDENNTINQQVSENNESNKKIEEKLYKKFEELFPKVEKVLQDNGINYEIIKNKLENNKYNEYESINVSKVSKPGVFSDIGYGLGTDKEDNISDIRIVMFLGVDNEEIKSNGFKIEETMFNDMSKILIKDGIDYSDTNSKINELYNSGDEDTIINEYDNVQEVITVASDYIGYSITINP